MAHLPWSRGDTLPASLTPGLADTQLGGLAAAGEGPSLLRLWRGFMAARCVVAVVLLLLQGVSVALGQPWQSDALGLVVAYLVATLLALRLATPVQRPMHRLGLRWLGTAGVDLAVFTALQLLQGGSVNYTPLFALPVLMSAVLGTLPVGLGTTAAVTLLLLADAAWHNLQPGEASSRFAQAALTGTGLFAVALLAHELAQRLARAQLQAQRHHGAAEMHAQVNDLVIEALTEGVLVVDARGRVHAANPAADEILGRDLARLPLPFNLAEQPAWVPLAALVEQTFDRRAPQSAEIPLAQAQSAARETLVRTRLTPASAPHIASLCVMFLQDLRELEARVRTEKLAAMGRMSAAVAHEIRNPLAAITQASALLAEDLRDPAQRRLTGMVQHNAQRLARIVDDVLDVARARQQRLPMPAARLALDVTVRHLSEEWVRQTQRQGVLLLLDAPGREVGFEVEHLRRILVNLLDNAARYAGEREGSIQVATLRLPGDGLGLQVWSDGAPLEPAVQRHLFEPFFSSESRSSGLGLFLCRELCERHGASIGYARRALSARGPEGNAFFVRFAAAPPQPSTDASAQ